MSWLGRDRRALLGTQRRRRIRRRRRRGLRRRTTRGDTHVLSLSGLDPLRRSNRDGRCLLGDLRDVDLRLRRCLLLCCL